MQRLTSVVNSHEQPWWFFGLMLIVSSLPIFANVGLATTFFKYITPNTLLSQFAGIIVVYVWNYAASSRLVWNN